MNLKHYIRSEKTDIAIADWQSGHISRRSFPLSYVSDKKYKLGKTYSSRIINFKIDGICCKVLIELNEEKQIFRTFGAVEGDDGDMIVLCRHEFHIEEPGWHCHLSKEDHTNSSKGSRGNGLIRYPKNENLNENFNVSKDNALGIVAKFFNFEQKGPLL